MNWLGKKVEQFVSLAHYLSAKFEIIFEVLEYETDGGFKASALGYGIHTQGEDAEELRANVKEAVECHFDEKMDVPKVICLHFGSDQTFTI